MLYNIRMQPRTIMLLELIKFRSLMNVSLSKDKVKYIWGKKFLKSLDKEILEKLKEEKNQNVEVKIDIAKKGISKLMLFDWVKFVGISGSVAAGFVKDEDDIDIFVVVKDGTMWIYRAIVMFRNIYHKKIRVKKHKQVKNKLCLNLICEERGVEFENDIFNFHELMFLIPIYKKGYINNIYFKNKWLITDYGVKKELLRNKLVHAKKTIFPVRVINTLSFWAQLLFMEVAKHNPDKKRLVENSKKGRIEFFEHDYRKKRLSNYLKEFKSTS